ncbi:MAG: cytochrome-c oxidase, cbb3-type subunit III [Pseudomonadales bacterium]|nr:cytochrome-c oxidase, cbb3-type subunit III [Pseudomonadales bacterium]
MSSFWSGWIILLTTITFIGVTLLLFGNRKIDAGKGPEAKTGHVYDGIEEYDNPLPAWWMNLFALSIVFGVGYLIAYPGMGNFKGVLNWTQVAEYENAKQVAEEQYGAVFAKYAAMPVEEVAKDSQALKMGQRLFSTNCSTCHGADAGGNLGYPNLRDNDWLYGGSGDQIKASITNGRQGAMPAWGTMGEEKIKQLTSYVMSLSNPSSALSGEAQQGKAAFAMCMGCHGMDGKGNTALGAPDLTDNIWLYGGSKEAISESIANGRKGQMPAHAELLGEEKIHLLAAYVFSLSN